MKKFSQILVVSLSFLSVVSISRAQKLNEKYYGNVVVETSRFDDRNNSEKTYGTSLEIFSKETAFKYNLGLYRASKVNSSGDIMFFNPSYKMDVARVGVLLRSDDLNGFLDKALTFSINTEAEGNDLKITPYVYGHLGVRDFNDKGNASNYLIRFGVKKELYGLELEKKYIGSVGDYGSVSTTTINPRAEFMVGNSGDLYLGLNYQNIHNSGNVDLKRVNVTEASLKWLVDKGDVVAFTMFERASVNGLSQRSNDSGAYLKYFKYF